MLETEVLEERVESEESKAIVLGKKLQQLRESRGYSIEDVAGQLYLDCSMITALESGDYDKIPSPAYVKGYIRNFIKIFNAMPEFKSFNLYDSDSESIKNIKTSNLSETFNVPVKKIAYTKLLALFIVLGVIFGIYQLEVQFNILSKIKNVSPSTMTVAEESSVNNEVTSNQDVGNIVTEKNSANLISSNVSSAIEPTKHVTYNHLDSIKLQFSHDSWTQIKDADGKKLISRLVKMGEELNFSGKLPFTVTLGDSRAVKIQVNDNDFKQSNYNKKQISHFVIN